MQEIKAYIAPLPKSVLVRLTEDPIFELKEAMAALVHGQLEAPKSILERLKEYLLKTQETVNKFQTVITPSDELELRKAQEELGFEGSLEEFIKSLPEIIGRVKKETEVYIKALPFPPWVIAAGIFYLTKRPLLALGAYLIMTRTPPTEA